MFSVEQDMRLRLSEAQDLINLINEIELGRVTSPQRINTPVLRSSVVLSLYNIIESTITQTLTKIHNEINASKVNYNNLSKEIKDLALIYFYKHKSKRNDIHESIDVLHHTVDLIRGKGFFNIPYNEMIESYQLYSGNLDSRIIRKVMKKYGVVISESHGTRLHAIKNGRNTLAHGNKSFEEFGRDMVVPTLNIYLSDVDCFLSEVITSTRDFIRDKKYRRQRNPLQNRR